jgi:predicted house-cleaning noncanonical NTP pyrophosphatase (MazG superfamily)
MPKFKFNKLVRDKIAENQIASGAKPHYRVLSDKQHKFELVNKIIEEAQEITKANQNDVAAEQAVDDLKEKLGLTGADIAKAQKAKNKKNGPFKKGIYIDYVEIDETDKWTEYYRKNADRYPEIK